MITKLTYSEAYSEFLTWFNAINAGITLPRLGRISGRKEQLSCVLNEKLLSEYFKEYLYTFEIDLEDEND